ncbi:MAG: hypothetical protein FWH55_14775 [Oscillospiraceae bacterium]|nr:hypothetical protein [Oscillospiraceae bacterium]
MLTAEQIQGLKRSNISVSSDKTKLRFEELFKPAKIKQKQAIRELAGVTSQVAHNTYNTGNISIKMVIAISQVLNINPFYLTGETDEPSEFSDEALRDLLLTHSYSDLVARIELPEKRRKSSVRRQSAFTELAQAVVDDLPAKAEEKATVEVLPLVPAFLLEETEQLTLLIALRIRAKAGIDGAKEQLDHINRLLLREE